MNSYDEIKRLGNEMYRLFLVIKSTTDKQEVIRLGKELNNLRDKQNKLFEQVEL